MNMTKLFENTALLIRVDGTVEQVSPSNGDNFSLADMYGHIECELVQVLGLGQDSNAILIIDDEGKLKDDVRVNPIATHLYNKQFGDILDVIVGNVIVCHRSMLK